MTGGHSQRDIILSYSGDTDLLPKGRRHVLGELARGGSGGHGGHGGPSPRPATHPSRRSPSVRRYYNQAIARQTQLICPCVLAPSAEEVKTKLAQLHPRGHSRPRLRCRGDATPQFVPEPRVSATSRNCTRAGRRAVIPPPTPPNPPRPSLSHRRDDRTPNRHLCQWVQMDS